jgi:hypothetical protein
MGTELSNLNLESLTKSVFIGVCFTALRAGIKALAEYLPTLIKK